MKLTNKEIAKVFAMYYPCRYRHNHLYDLDLNGTVIHAISTGELHSEHLLLTPLSKISDLHKKEILELTTSFKVDGVKKYDLDFSDYTILGGAVTDRLRKLGYDTPLDFGNNHWANGKTAIELRLAIDKTSLQ